MGESKFESKFDLWDAIGTYPEEAYYDIAATWAESAKARRGADEVIISPEGCVGEEGYALPVVFVRFFKDEVRLEAGFVAVAEHPATTGVCIIVSLVQYKDVKIFPGGPYLLEAEFLVEEMKTVWEEA